MPKNMDKINFPYYLPIAHLIATLRIKHIFKQTVPDHLDTLLHMYFRYCNVKP